MASLVMPALQKTEAFLVQLECEMKPIIFLDFDGVLNSFESVMVLDTYEKLNPISVGLVAKLVADTDAEVVISSAWRRFHTIEELKDILNGFGGRAISARIVGATPSDVRIGPTDKMRGVEIAKWRHTNNRTDSPYAILDDDSDMLDNQLPHFVRCPHWRGFGLNEFLQACEILGHDSNDVRNLRAIVEWRKQNETESV